MDGARNAGVARGGKKPKFVLGCGRGGHFRGDKSCPVRDQACKKCRKIRHFQIKCTQGNRNRGKKFEKGKSGSGEEVIGADEMWATKQILWEVRPFQPDGVLTLHLQLAKPAVI